MLPELKPFLAGLPGDAVSGATRLGLKLAKSVDPGTWSQVVAQLVQTTGRLSGHRDTLTAWLGDVLAYGAGKYHGQITEYAKAAGLSPGTLRDAKLVCSRIPFALRQEKLSWSHHCEIGKAFSGLAEIERWLAVALKEKLSTSALRQRIRAHLNQSRPAAKTVDVPTFRLLRELRALDRLLGSNRAVWKEWTGDARRCARGEFKVLMEFATALNAGAVKLDAAS